MGVLRSGMASIRRRLTPVFEWFQEVPAANLLRWGAVTTLCLGGLGGWAALAPPTPERPAAIEPATLDEATLREWLSGDQTGGLGDPPLRVGSLNTSLPTGQDTYVYLSVDRLPEVCRTQACQLVLEAAAPFEPFAIVEPGVGVSRSVAMMMPFRPEVLGPHNLRAVIRTTRGPVAVSEATPFWGEPARPTRQEILEAGAGGLVEPRLLLLFPGLLALFLQLGARRQRRIPRELQLMWKTEDELVWQVEPVRNLADGSFRQTLREQGLRATTRQLVAHLSRPEVAVSDLLDLRETVELKLRPGEEGEVRVANAGPFQYRRQSDRSATACAGSEGELSLPLGSLLTVNRVQLVLGYPEMVDALREGILRVPEVPRGREDP